MDKIADKMIGLAIGVYIIAYVLVQAILALVNTTGFAANSPVGNLVTVVVPILAALAAVIVIYHGTRGK